MLLAYHQRLDPLRDLNFPGSATVSTLFAALPVLVLFWLLVPRRWFNWRPEIQTRIAVAAAILVALGIGFGVNELNKPSGQRFALARLADRGAAGL